MANSIHVDGLRSPVRSGVGGAGHVGGQKAVVAWTALDEPDEAGTEHGGGGDDKLAAEGLDGGEAGFEFGL